MIKEIGSQRKTRFSKSERNLIVNSKMGVRLTEHEANDILKLCYKYKLTTEEVLNCAFIDYPNMDFKEAIHEMILDSGIIQDNIERTYYNLTDRETLWSK